MAGIVVMSVIALTSTSSFGLPGRSALHTGWPGWTVLCIALGGVALIAIRARRILAFIDPLVTDPGAEEAATSALSACPAPFRTRFFLGWIGGPLGVAVLGVVFAFSAAYFAIDALLARFSVSWTHAAFTTGNIVLGLAAFRTGAGRIATASIALAAYRNSAPY
jgi:hypothetical protein